MDSAESALERLCDPSAEVSAHYLIDRAGQVMRLVDEVHRAWHAGAGEWCGQNDLNSRSIGIELDNDGSSPFSAPMMDALEDLLEGVLRRWTIVPRRVIGHADFAPGRKVDPGPRFDWARLQRLGLAASLDVSLDEPLFHVPFESAECETLLSKIGYARDAPLPAKLQAFRDRFLPVSRGAPNAADRQMMHHYLDRFTNFTLQK